MLQMDKLEKEIEEMEKAFSNPTEVATEGSVKVEDEKVVNTEVINAKIDNTETTLDKPKRQNWKKRYTNFKVSTDATIFSLRKDLAASIATIEKLSGQVEELMKAEPVVKQTFEEKFSKEDRDVLGDDALKSMNTAMEDMVAPLKEELAQAKKDKAALLKKQREDATASAASIFLQKLSDEVPDYEEIDVDPAFAEYLQQIDPLSGFTRLDLFKRAEQGGDVARVAMFMNNFTKEQGKGNAELDKHITPSTNSSQGSDTHIGDNTEVITPEFIDKFYEDSIRGVYRGREKERITIEDKIDAHLAKVMGG